MKEGYFGQFGGRFVPEFLYPALVQLQEAFDAIRKDALFQKTYTTLLSDYVGRPTPLYFARHISEEIGCRVYLKREDLNNGGSHKINNAIGQALIAQYMGKTMLLTETAAGMHGVATAMAANVVGLSCKVYMGVKDIERQKTNAEKIELLGGEVVPVTRGHGVLKDAVSDALVAWIRALPSSHYLIGSAVGPAPFPQIVGYFQRMIGKEAKRQILHKEGRLPTSIIACGSGGSNALGIYQSFEKDTTVELVFVEGGGEKLKGGYHAAAFQDGSVGIFQGSKTYLVQDQWGMDRKTESRSAGLNYPARGPQLSYLFEKKRITAAYATDQEVLDAYVWMAKTEGLLPAFETCHAIAELQKRKGRYKKEDVVILNFSGRGDKDMGAAMTLLQAQNVKHQVPNKSQI